MTPLPERLPESIAPVAQAEEWTRTSGVHPDRWGLRQHAVAVEGDLNRMGIDDIGQPVMEREVVFLQEGSYQLRPWHQTLPVYRGPILRDDLDHAILGPRRILIGRPVGVDKDPGDLKINQGLHCIIEPVKEAGMGVA